MLYHFFCISFGKQKHLLIVLCSHGNISCFHDNNPVNLQVLNDVVSLLLDEINEIRTLLRSGC